VENAKICAQRQRCLITNILKAFERFEKCRGFNEATQQALHNDAAILHMDDTGIRCCTQVTLARFLIVNFFISMAQGVAGGLQPKEHRRLWVLLQVHPRLFCNRDIFAELSALLNDADIQFMNQRITSEYQKLRSTLQAEYPNAETLPPLFLAVDEAQVTTHKAYAEFVSRDSQRERPELKPLWLVITSVLFPKEMRVVLLGTGIEIKAIKDTLGSVTLKPANFTIKSNIGAFENPEFQAGYIKYYVSTRWSDPKW
jgi:hypothetical protein